MVTVFILAGFASGSSLVHGPALGIVITGGVFLVLGFLPPTAPIAMPVLYSAGDVPLWQVVVSAAICAAGTVGHGIDGTARDQDLHPVDPAHGPPHPPQAGPPAGRQPRLTDLLAFEDDAYRKI
jgi:hypothetical protein